MSENNVADHPSQIWPRLLLTGAPLFVSAPNVVRIVTADSAREVLGRLVHLGARLVDYLPNLSLSAQRLGPQ